MQRQILFRCPRTGMNVQHGIDDQRLASLEPADSYVPVRCPACVSLHFINSITGKLLSERNARPVASPHSA